MERSSEQGREHLSSCLSSLDLSWRGRSRTRIFLINSQAYYLPLLGLYYTPMKLPGQGSNPRLPRYYARSLSIELPRKKEHKLSRIKQNGEPSLSWWGVRVTIPAGLCRLIYSQARLLSGLPPQKETSSFLGDYVASTSLHSVAPEARSNEAPTHVSIFAAAFCHCLYCFFCAS